MVVSETDKNRNCYICRETLRISRRPSYREGWGVCERCGAPYEFENKNDCVKITQAEKPESDLMIQILEEYYSETGNTATIFMYGDFSEEQIRSFIEWTRENYPEIEFSDQDELIED